MIAYLPEIYEDETVHSLLCRYHSHIGYPNYNNTFADLFVSGNHAPRYNIEYIGNLNDEARQAFDEVYGMENLILRHTMYPQYARYADMPKRKEALERLAHGDGIVYRVLPTYKSENRQAYIRYCPICAKEDREKKGEAYFHRIHQLRGIEICARHGCKLKDTGTHLSCKSSSMLMSADESIKDLETEYVDNEQEIEFVRYVAKIFESPIDMENDTPIAKLFSAKIEDTNYISETGGAKRGVLLQEDLTRFYHGFSVPWIPSLKRLHQILPGCDRRFFEICQIAYFLGIPVDEMAYPFVGEKSRYEQFREKVMELRKEGIPKKRIARMLGVSNGKVFYLLKEKQTKASEKSEKRVQQKKDWDLYDTEMFAKVKQVTISLYGGSGTRPEKVSEGAVTRLLGMSQHSLNHMPKCKGIVSKYQETWEIHWARRLVWCYQMLKNESERISYKKLLAMSGMQKQSMVASFPYLEQFASKEEAEAIRSLI